ncbi:MAG: acylase [Phenylobacterium sp.]|uniref:acylase n=1 Tax=Phenylobacterium sp. TaxID=1871053 RepID=UPI001A376A6D|nr:acylase [Phenylobacterium sp.]MBL8773781.1 acylase [Phenylobacterium sp.]
MRGAIIGLAAAMLAVGAQAAPDVTIRRDSWGVPHILGRTDADAAYGLAWAQSEDDFATLQEAVFAARGRLAELNGPAGVESDYLVALQDVWGTVRRRYARDLEPKTKAVMEAYAAGASAWARAHPDKVAPGLLPITGQDLAASVIYRGPTFYGLDDLFRRTMRPTSQRRAEVWDGVEIGSNGVAVGPARSADGATRLLVNSHQPYTGPLAWYEAVVQSREGWHVAGGFFPGGPFMLHGHNARLGWASTVDNPDLADVYQLVMHPTDRELYRLDGAWKRLESRWVEIRVKRADGSLETVRRETLRSVHGPVVRTDHGVFAIRYAGMDEIRQNEQYFAMNKARNLAEWKAAMAKGVLPSINYVYADADGNVGYVHNGRFPVRKDGVDWSGVVPGDRSDLIWTRQRPFSGVPQLWNPKSGWTYNANNTPFSATDPAHDLKPADFPKWMGLQTNMTNRAFRALETYGADPSITAEEFEAYKYDLAFSAKSELGKALPLLLALPAGDDADLKAAQDLLRGWDLRTHRDSRAAALAVLTVLRLNQQPGTAPLSALKGVMADLKKAYGRIDPTWGEVNRIRRGTVDLPIDGGPDIFRAVYGRPDPDGRLRAVAGDTFVMFVTWEKGGRLSSKSIHQFGSATLDAASPHYADQTPLFAAMQTKPVLFTEDQLKGHVKREYRPGE